MDKRNYFIYHNDRFMRLNEYFSENSLLHRESFLPVQELWSARLGTGLFGCTYCYSGNRGPKSYSEVLLASGDKGLVKLIDLGFITCPVCKPDELEGFWEAAGQAIEKKYGEEYDIHNLADFVNKDILTFDARRVNWEELAPVIGAFPSRMYIPPGLNDGEISGFEGRLKTLHKEIPDIGYLDKNAQPWRFVSYVRQ